MLVSQQSLRNLSHEEMRALMNNPPRYEKVLVFLARGFGRSASFSRYFRMGKAHGYPTCCVVHFSWEVSAFNRKGPGCGVKRGGIHLTEEDIYVPCALHTRRGPYWRPHHDRGPRQGKLFTMEPKS